MRALAPGIMRVIFRRAPATGAMWHWSGYNRRVVTSRRFAPSGNVTAGTRDAFPGAARPGEGAGMCGTWAAPGESAPVSRPEAPSPQSAKIIRRLC